MTTTPDLPIGFDPTDPSLNQERIPLKEFMELRQTAPVFWVEQPEESRAGMEGGTGYWALSKHDDVSAASRSKEFVTSENSAIIRFAAGDDPRPGGDAARHADQPGSAGPHRRPPDHQPRLHAAVDRGAA